MTTQNLRVRALGERRALVVWAVLVSATCASYLLGAEHAIEKRDAVAALVIGVAFFKVRLVAMHFMELSRAPAMLRILIEAYCLMTPFSLIALYLTA